MSLWLFVVCIRYIIIFRHCPTRFKWLHVCVSANKLTLLSKNTFVDCSSCSQTQLFDLHCIIYAETNFLTGQAPHAIVWVFRRVCSLQLITSEREIVQYRKVKIFKLLWQPFRRILPMDTARAGNWISY